MNNKQLTIHEPNFELLKKVAGDLFGQVDEDWLLRRSPVDPRNITVGDFLHKLYGQRLIKREKVLISYSGKDLADSIIWPEDGFKDASNKGVWFLPQPFHADNLREDITFNSKISVSSFRYIVLKNTWAPSFSWLAAMANVAVNVTCIVSSGKNKIHILSRIDAQNQRDFDSVVTQIKKMELLGTHVGSSMDWMRLPGCYRNVKGHLKEQRLLYFDPDSGHLPINELHERRKY